jgi:uncharacterized membrane protein
VTGATPASPGIATRIWIGVLVFSCVGVALYAISFLGGRDFSAEVSANYAGYAVLLTHAVAAGVALALGPWQFVRSIRMRWPKVHRAMGKGYLIACLVGGAAGVALAVGTAFGNVARIAFILLGTFWIATTVLAYLAVRRRDFSNHRKWMIRSLALAFSAVTLRIYLPASLMSGFTFPEGYPLIAWACWVPNLLLAELYIALARDPLRPRAARAGQEIPVTRA